MSHLNVDTSAAKTGAEDELSIVAETTNTKIEANSVVGEEGKQDDPIVTVTDMIKEFDNDCNTAKALYGNQDQSVCTYPEGYKPRQTVFACLTCTPESQKAGVCYGCSLNCHDGHEIVELYTKRKFRCDCGNEKFGEFKCTLYEEKDGENGFNLYNDNFRGRFCECKVYYPSEDATGEVMIQCEVCEDWFHPSHVKCTLDPTTEDTNTTSKDLICTDCVNRFPFLEKLRGTAATVCFTSDTTSQREASVSTGGILVEDLRRALCKCLNCIKTYETSECDFLIDPDDDIETYEKENMKKAEEDDTRLDNEEVQTLVKEVGMENTINIIGAVNDFKRKMVDWMGEMSVSGKVVSESDVNTFFNKLHEERDAKRTKKDD